MENYLSIVHDFTGHSSPHTRVIYSIDQLNGMRFNKSWHDKNVRIRTVSILYIISFPWSNQTYFWNMIENWIVIIQWDDTVLTDNNTLNNN